MPRRDGAAEQLNVRVPSVLKAELVDAAKANGRSLNQEAVARLVGSNEVAAKIGAAICEGIRAAVKDAVAAALAKPVAPAEPEPGTSTPEPQRRRPTRPRTQR